MGEGHLNGGRMLAGSSSVRSHLPPDPDRIGTGLAVARQQILSCGHSLASLVEPAGKALVDEAMGRLEQESFRIAVVGQIKSGKSSLINALVRQPRLLPTDVTPWTTTVTHMHFSRARPHPAAAASFEFFSTAEWHDLANGDSRIRELTRHIDPTFESDLLRRHVEAMQQRAAMRLGSNFADLLGSAHNYAAFDTDLLSRYVCSGVAADRSAVGQFADITKLAHLYFDNGPFAFPTTVTDTPGTNDPSLIRDEITRRCLDQADLYIVVVTARQPLSEADVNLMRLMRGLNSDRIVVYVNRIDDFSDVSYDVAEVMMYVERKLKAEFPGANIPVIAGSASWANCAMAADTEALARLMQRPSFGYLADLGLVQREELQPSALMHGDSSRLSRALYIASGMPTLYHAVSQYMGASPAARLQDQTARWFSEMANASGKATSFEFDALRTASPTQGPRDQAGRPALEREMGVLNEVAANIERSSKTIQSQFASIIEEEMADLNQSLTSIIGRHAMDERRVLVSTLKSGGTARTWTLEGVALRRALADAFKGCFDRATTRVLALQTKVAPELAKLMGLIAPEIPMPAEPEKRLLLVPSPSMAALSRFVALDIGGSWWSSLWKGRTSPELYGVQIEALIKDEFRPVADELVATAERALNAYATMSTKWSFGLCANIIQAVKRRREQLMDRLGGANGNVSAVPSQRPDPQMQVLLAERLRRLRAISHQLDMVNADLGYAQPRERNLAL